MKSGLLVITCQKLNLRSSMKNNTGITTAKYAKENHDYGKEGGLLSDNERHSVHPIMTLAPKTQFFSECFTGAKILDFDKIVKIVRCQFLSID